MRTLMYIEYLRTLGDFSKKLKFIVTSLALISKRLSSQGTLRRHSKKLLQTECLKSFLSKETYLIV